MLTGNPAKTSSNVLPAILWREIMSMLFSHEVHKPDEHFKEMLTAYWSLAHTNKINLSQAKILFEKFLKTLTEKPEHLMLDDWPSSVRAILAKSFGSEPDAPLKLAAPGVVYSDTKDEKDPPQMARTETKETKVVKPPAENLSNQLTILELVIKCHERLWQPCQVILDWEKYTDNQLAQAFFSIAKANAEKLFIRLFTHLPNDVRQRLRIENDNFYAEQLLQAEQLKNPSWKASCPVSSQFLHIAAFYGNVDLIDFLLKQSRNSGAVNGDGKTALWIAANLGHIDVTKVLVRLSGAHADLDSPYSPIFCPLTAAIDNGHLEVVDLILKAKAEICSEVKFRAALKNALERTLKVTRKNALGIVQLIFFWMETVATAELYKLDFSFSDSTTLVEALRAFPIAGKKFLPMVLDFQERIPKVDPALENFKKAARYMDAFKVEIESLIKRELQHLKLSSAAETKTDSIIVPQKLYKLWQSPPKDLTERAEKNVIFALLMEYLQKPHGRDEKTGIDVFDIIEIGIEISSRRWGGSATEYSKPLRELLMTPEGKLYLPFKFRSEIIKELQEELQFLYGLVQKETGELNALRNRIFPLKVILPPISGSPVESITPHLLGTHVVNVTTPVTSTNTNLTVQSDKSNLNLPSQQI